MSRPAILVLFVCVSIFLSCALSQTLPTVPTEYSIGNILVSFSFLSLLKCIYMTSIVNSLSFAYSDNSLFMSRARQRGGERDRDSGSLRGYSE